MDQTCTDPASPSHARVLELVSAWVRPCTWSLPDAAATQPQAFTVYGLCSCRTSCIALRMLICKVGTKPSGVQLMRRLAMGSSGT